MPEHRTVNEHGQVIVEVPVHRNNTPYLLLCGGKYAGAWYGRLRIGDSSDDVADRSRAADLKGQEGTLQAMASAIFETGRKPNTEKIIRVLRNGREVYGDLWLAGVLEAVMADPARATT
jgi:hypothetical protein